MQKITINKNVLTISIFSIVITTLYFALFSTYFANSIFIMQIRNAYITTINKVTNGYNNRIDVDYHSYLLPIVRPLMIIKNNGNYLYEFIGRYESFDEVNNLIYFKCSNDKLYAFKVESISVDSQNSNINVKLNQSNNKFVSIPFNSSDKTFKFHVLFESNRSLTEILHDYRKNINHVLNSTHEIVTLVYTN